MRKYQRDFVVNATAFTLFVLLAATGILMRFVLPKGSGESLAVWGLGRHDWGAVHFWIAASMLAIIALHLLFNRHWVVSVVRGRRNPATAGRRVAAGLAAVVVLLALALAPLLSPVTRTGKPAEHELEAGMAPPPLGLPGAGHVDAAPSAGAPRVLVADSSGCAPVEQGEIHGTMSLAEVVRSSGIPMDLLVRGLRLPAGVPRDRPLRELTREHGFTMDDVRRVVTDYLKHC